MDEIASTSSADDQELRIKELHAEMIFNVGEYIDPKIANNDWEKFLTLLTSTLKPVDLYREKNSFYAICEALKRKGKIDYGSYTVLYKAVSKVYVTAAEIIKAASDEIQAVRSAGPTEAKQRKKADEDQDKGRNSQLKAMIGRNSQLKAMIETTRSTTDVQTSKPEVISIQALEDAKEMIRKNSIVLIKGASGDGKTLMGYQLLKWLMDSDNDTRPSKDPVQLYSMAKWDETVEPNAQLAVYIDDISWEIAEDLKKREVSIKSTFCGKLNNRSNCLILNVRDEIFKSTQLSSCEFFKQNIIDLRGKNCIKIAEKQLILESYVPDIKTLTGGKESEIIKLAPDIGFPQCCHLFKYVSSLQNEGVDFFKQPFHFMETTLEKLPKEHFSALLFLFLNEGSVQKGDLDPKNTESFDKKKLDEAFQGIKLDHADKIRSLRKSLDVMCESLVAKYPDDDDDDDDSIYKFCHDSVQDTVAFLYVKDTKIGFIENCPRMFLHYISTSKSTANKIVIKSSSEHVYKRLVRECMYERLVGEFESNAHRLSDYIVRLDVWTDTLFLQGFIRWLSGQNYDNNLCHLIKCALLNGACSTGFEDHVSYLLSEGAIPNNDTPFCVVEGGSVQLLRQLLKYDVIPTARACWSGSPHYIDNINVLHQACLLEREEMVTILCDTYPDLVHDTDTWGHSMLHFVAQTGNCRIFQTVERTVLKSLCRVEDVQHKCETEDGRVVHRSCLCGQYMSQLVDKLYGKTILHHSCESGHRELSLYLCKSYPALTTAVDNNGKTILHWSCWSGNKELSLQLCELYPALIKAVTIDQKTVIHYSCMFGHKELILELCKLDQELTTTVDNKGKTVLLNSCRWGQKELSLELCKLDPALTTAVNKDGYHCLHYIAKWTTDVDMFTECERHVKQYLETTGGKYDITTILTNDGKSVLDLATEQTEMVRKWERKLYVNPLHDHLVKIKELNIHTSIH